MLRRYFYVSREKTTGVSAQDGGLITLLLGGDSRLMLGVWSLGETS